MEIKVLKLYLLLALIWVAPAMGMCSTEQEVLNNPNFLQTRKKFECVGAKIIVQNGFIYVHHNCLDELGHAIYLGFPDYLRTFEKCYLELHKQMSDSKAYWLERRLKYRLEGLCIFALAKECAQGNQYTIARVASLPEDLREQILFLADRYQGIK